MSAPRSLWRWPVVLGVLTVSGLVSALLSDGGWGDAWSWLALGIPVAVMAWFSWRRRPAAPATPARAAPPP